MSAEIRLQRKQAQVSQFLGRTFAGHSCSEMGVAVAFASVAGVTELLESILAGQLPARSYWLFGLDNYITHPDAIERVRKLAGAEVRVARAERKGGIFHPKLYWFTDGKSKSSLVLGSANLTMGGLSHNVEAVACMKSRNKGQAEAFDALWKSAWKVGRRVTPQLIREYRVGFDRAREARRKAGLVDKKMPTKRSRPILASDDARVDPSLAKICWIEVGKITGFHQDQLEIKAEQALFFSWPTSGGPNRELRVRLADGSFVVITAQYFGNHMWRLWLPQGIPEVRHGLRRRTQGKLLRSDYVAVFERNGRFIDLRFLSVASGEFKSLREATEQAGTLGRTSAREYGWV
ncbi:phospholipase D-like domain-containing protein [Frateuria sp. YIM B11624]|uniref:phospholipase D-like domain-containing protein n=1 Tax=Frateuria sp. YIM B11624 TaxID=3143185 RepID=UPI003C75FB74